MKKEYIDNLIRICEENISGYYYPIHYSLILSLCKLDIISDEDDHSTIAYFLR